MAKLELALLVGEQSKGFLASLTTQIDRLEALAGKLGGTASEAAGYVDDEEDEIPKKTAKKKTAVADDEDYNDETVHSKHAGDDDDEPEIAANPAKKKKKAAKLTADDVNDALKALAKATDFKTAKSFLKKKFKVDSVVDLDEEDYAEVIAAVVERTEEEE